MKVDLAFSNFRKATILLKTHFNSGYLDTMARPSGDGWDISHYLPYILQLADVPLTLNVKERSPPTNPKQLQVSVHILVHSLNVRSRTI